MAHEQRPEERGLEEIRREVIESRNLVIKTDNLLKNLHAELKMVSKRQEDFQKRQWISSAVAYGLFAALCVAGAVLVSSARSASATADRERLDKEIGELTAQIDKLKADAKADADAERTAGEVYRLMTTLPGDERLKGVDALAKLDRSRLSVLEKQALDDRATQLRKEIGQTAFERGKSAFRKQDYNGAIEDLTRFLAMNPSPEEALDASFFLGAALTQVRKAEQAIPYLARFVKEDKSSKTRDYALLLLAQAYDQTSQFEKAMEVARDAMAAYPNSQFLSQLKSRFYAARRALNAPAVAGQPAAAQLAPAQPGKPAKPADDSSAAASGAPAAAAPAPAE